MNEIISNSESMRLKRLNYESHKKMRTGISSDPIDI